MRAPQTQSPEEYRNHWQRYENRLYKETRAKLADKSRT